MASEYYTLLTEQQSAVYIDLDYTNDENCVFRKIITSEMIICELQDVKKLTYLDKYTCITRAYIDDNTIITTTTNNGELVGKNILIKPCNIISIADLPDWEEYDFCNDAVKYDFDNVKYIKNYDACIKYISKNYFVLGMLLYQSNDVCMFAIKKNGNNIQYVNICDNTLNEAAVKQNGLSLKYIKNQTEDICIHAITQNILAIQYVKHITNKILSIVTNYITNANISADEHSVNIEEKIRLICSIEVKKDYKNLKHVIKQTNDMCEYTVSKNGNMLFHVKQQTDKICMIALHQNIFVFEHVINKTPDICKYVLSKNGYLIGTLDNQTYEYCELALNTNPHSLVVIRNPTFKICQLAYSLDNSIIAHIKNKNVVDRLVNGILDA